MRKLFLMVVAIASLTSCAPPTATSSSNTVHNTASASPSSDQILANAFQNRTSDLQVQGVGQVSKILADDNDGSRHQKFILRLNSGQTILVAHNIDIAPRIGSLKMGDTVEFYGEYEWNEQGGIIHWTHHDPTGKHIDGWLSHNGDRYE